MPRATRSAARKTDEYRKRYSEDAEFQPKSGVKPVDVRTRKTSAAPRTGNGSHLYTDDNPTTMLKGTGFKNAEDAEQTIRLVSKRSLLYKFQTINTMFHRASHRPYSKANADTQAAMSIFRKWVEETYAAKKEKQTDFPLLPLREEDVVELCLPKIDARAEALKIDPKWVERYVALLEGKMLANVLMDEANPAEADLAVVRQTALEELAKERGRSVPQQHDRDLWDGRGDGVSSLHLRCIAYGFSSVKPNLLIRAFASR